jgi:oligosaccharide repeat unit polymerase
MTSYFHKDRFLNPLLISITLFIYYTIGFLNPFEATVHNITITEITSLKTYLIGIVGVLFYMLGIKLAQNKSVYYEKRNFSISLKRYRIAVILCTIIGALFALPAYIKMGLPILNLENMNLERKIFVWGMSPYIYYQWYFLEIGILLSAIGFYKVENFLNKLLFVIPAIINFTLILPVASRVTVAEGLFYILFARNFFKKAISLRNMFIIILPSVIVISVIWHIRVYGIYSILVSDIGQFLYLLFEGLVIFCRTSFEAFAYFVELNKHLYGSISFMSFIQLLPGKQAFVGLYLVSELMGKNSSLVGGTTVSLVGGLFIDFGIIGVIVGMLVLGFYLKLIYEKFIHLNSVLYGGIYAISLFYYLAMIYGGQYLDVSLIWKIFIWVSIHRVFLSNEKINKIIEYIPLLMSTGGVILGFYHLLLFISQN